MKRFKKFHKKINVIIGFASIRNNDEADDNLKLPKDKKPEIGFATIHGRDKTDNQLKEVFNPAFDIYSSDAKETHAETEDQYHNKFIKHLTDSGDYIKPSKTSNNFMGVRSLSMKHEKEDPIVFSNHHRLNAIDKYTKHINGYTAGDSGDINALLINREKTRKNDEHNYIPKWDVEYNDKSKKHFYKQAAKISKSLKNKENALDKPTIVHSGVHINMAKILQKSKVGDSIHFPAFTSASTNVKMANKFASSEESHPALSSKHTIHFHLPKGYVRGRHIQNISRFPEENEFLLDKNQKFKKVGYGTSLIAAPNNNNYILVHHHHFVPDD